MPFVIFWLVLMGLIGAGITGFGVYDAIRTPDDDSIIVALVAVYVVRKAWPAFAHNGISILGSRAVPGMDEELNRSFGTLQGVPYRELHAWPAIYGTLLTTGGAVLLSVPFSILAAIFVAELAPRSVLRVVEPVVRLLAAVPSVVYGLIGILVLVPFVANHLISGARKESVAYVVQLTGAGWAVASVILAVMIVPIMIAIIVDALRAVPKAWTEGAAALGVNRWRVMWTIGLRTARPAIIAAVILASARALGEAIMLAMVSGSIGFIPNPADGLTFFLEPVRPLAAAIVDNAEGLSVVPFGQTIYAFAFVLLVSSMILSIGGWLAKRPMRRYGVRP